MATSKEKDGIIKALKERVRTLEEDLKKKIIPDKFNSNAVSLIKKGDIYYLIKLEFDSESGVGRVVSSTKLDHNFVAAVQKTKDTLANDVFENIRFKRGNCE